MTQPRNKSPLWKRVACVATCVALTVAMLPPAASAVGLPFVDIPDAGDVANDAINSATTSIVGMIADGAATLTNEIIRVSDTVGAPQVGSGNTWFSASYKRTVGVSLWLMAIAALIAIISAGVRGRIGDLVGVLLVNVPGSVLAMILVTVGVELALGLVDAMTAYTFRGSIPQIQQFLHDVGTTVASTNGATGSADNALAPGVALVIGLFMILAQLVILAVLVIRAALIYIVTLFLPLVLAVQVWPATRHMTRKALEMLAVLILSKFAIFTCFALGAGAYTSAASGTAHPVQSAIIGLGVMAVAAFSPMLLMSIIPGVAGTFTAPGSTGGARGAVGVNSAAQVMRSTLASVHTVRSHSSTSSSSTASRTSSTSRSSSLGSAALETAHTAAGGSLSAAAGAAGTPAAGAAVAVASEGTRTVRPAVSATVSSARGGKATSQKAPSGTPSEERSESGSRSSAAAGVPTAATPNPPPADAPAERALASVPAAAQTADGFPSVSTRQPFSLEST